MFFIKRKKKKPKYTAAIIGCGSIGALKPNKYDRPGGANIFTLAHAFDDHPDIETVSFIDHDKKKAEEALRKWGTANSKALHHLPEKKHDIVAIAVPEDDHLITTWRSVIMMSPDVIMAEKPFGDSYEALIQFLDEWVLPDNPENPSGIMKKTKTRRENEASGIEEFREEASLVPVGIDYIRRYVPCLQILKEELIDMSNEIYSCVVHYNRGLHRDGCHAIDFVRWFLGEIESVSNLPSDYRIHDYSEQDPTMSVCLSTKKCRNIVMLPVDGRTLSVFEVEFMTSGGKMSIRDNGQQIEIRKRKNNRYGNYQALDHKNVMLNTTLNQALYEYVDEAVQILDGKRESFSCTMADALRVHEVIRDVHEITRINNEEKRNGQD